MNTVYDIISILPFSMLFLMMFGSYAGIPDRSITGYAVCLIVSVWLIALRHMKKKSRLYSIGIVSVFLAGLTAAAGKEYRHLFFTKYFWIIWVCCFSAAVLIAGFVMNRSIWFKRAASAAPLVYCIACTVLNREIRKEFFALTCFILFVRTAEEVQRKWKKSGCPDMKVHINGLFPLFFAACLAVFLIPAPDKPYSWQFAKNLYHHAATFAIRLYGRFTHTSDDYASIGFSDSGGFSAGLNGNDELVLLIRADNKNVTDLKLVGCISCDFRGREWVFGNGSADTSRMLDTMETETAVRKFAPESRPDYYQKVNMDYENRFYNTQYVFSPAKIKLAETREKTAGIYEKNGSIFSKNRLEYKDRYKVSCYVLNSGNPHFQELLDTAEPITEAEWNETVISENIPDQSGYTFADYQNYRKSVYENYCHSYGLSEQANEILNQIRNSSDSRYEAVKMLESYLGNMEYSTDCGALPDSVTDAESFLDYFLFTSRKGYCMHYTTAFVLMANEMGIPCRYVQGYSVRKGVNGDIFVRQSNAHAWPEVYFDNAGWVAFEPTPGYADHTGWKVIENSSFDPGQNQTEPENPDEPQEPDSQQNASGQSAKAVNPLIFVIPALSVIGFLLLVYLISIAVSRKKYRNMNCEGKYRALTKQNLRYIGYLGFRMKEDETLSEFLNRITESGKEELLDCTGFIPVYETVLYSDRTVSEEDVKTAEDLRNKLYSLAKKSSLRHRLLLLIRR